MEFKSLEELQKYNQEQFEKLGVKKITTYKTENEISDYWERINFNSRRHDVLQYDWQHYYSLDFADSILSYADGIKAKGLDAFDGAELFLNSQKSERKLYLLDDNKYLINLITYTYPKGVTAENSKKYVQVGKDEVLTFMEIDKDNKIDIHFKFGERFAKHIDDYAKENKLSFSARSIESTVYNTDKETIGKYFKDSFVHYDMMKFVLETTGVKLPQFEPKENTKYKINGYWTDINNKKIREAHVEDTVRFCLETNLPEGAILDIELYDFDGNFYIPTFLGFVPTRILDDFIPLATTDEKQKPVNKLIVGKDGKSYLDIKLTRALEKIVTDDSGPSIELYFKCKHEYDKEKINIPLLEKDYLEVKHSKRNLFIKPASKNYTFPQVLDNDGGVILFLKKVPKELLNSDEKEEDKIKEFGEFVRNESGSVAESLKVNFSSFYAMKFTIIKEFEFSKPNDRITKIYEHTYNITTGDSTDSVLYEVTEKINARVKKGGKQVFLEEAGNYNVKKPIKDFFNIHDLGKGVWKGTQKSLELFGFIDLWDDILSLANGEKPTLYDTVGVPLDIAEIAGDFTGNPLNLPLKVNAILFGLAVFEETVVADAIDDLNEFVESAMVLELENAKIKGLEAVRKLFRSNDLISKNYILEMDVPQEIVNEILSGKRKMYDLIKIDSEKYRANTIQKYDLLFKKIEFGHVLETLILN